MILTDLPEVEDNGEGEGEDEDTLSKAGAVSNIVRSLNVIQMGRKHWIMSTPRKLKRAAWTWLWTARQLTLSPGKMS